MKSNACYSRSQSLSQEGTQKEVGNCQASGGEIVKMHAAAYN